MCMFNGDEVQLPPEGEVAYKALCVGRDDLGRICLSGYLGEYPEPEANGRFKASEVPSSDNEAGFFAYSSPERVRHGDVVAKVRMYGRAVRNAPHEQPGLRAEYMEVLHVYVAKGYRLEDEDDYRPNPQVYVVDDSYGMGRLPPALLKVFNTQLKALEAQAKALNAWVEAVTSTQDEDVVLGLQRHYNFPVTSGTMPKPRKKAKPKKVAKKAAKRTAKKKK